MTEALQSIKIYKSDTVLQGFFNYGKQGAVLLLPPDPRYGANALNPVLAIMSACFEELGFSTLRLNYRGVGESKGNIHDLQLHKEDVLESFDWLQNTNQENDKIWVAGYGYGGYLSIDIAMRRPSVNGFISISPQITNHIELNMLTPCPSGIIINGTKDNLYRGSRLISKDLKCQSDAKIKFIGVQDADHFYTGCREELRQIIRDYLKEMVTDEELERQIENDTK